MIFHPLLPLLPSKKKICDSLLTREWDLIVINKEKRISEIVDVTASSHQKMKTKEMENLWKNTAPFVGAEKSEENENYHQKNPWWR